MDIQLKDERLRKRWLILVRSQMKSAPPLAAGIGSLPSTAKPLAATQAAWRFYNNDRVTLAELVVPLRDYARQRIAESPKPFVLVAHDWCKRSFPGHDFREDLTELSHESDVGYELTAALAISPNDGAPLAPVEMHIKTKDAVLSTRASVEPVAHLEQVLPTMQARASWSLGKPIVHGIDREADSIGHWRQWHAAGHQLLIRGDDRVAKWCHRANQMQPLVGAGLTHQNLAVNRLGVVCSVGVASRIGRLEATGSWRRALETGHGRPCGRMF
ncbi:MAG: hypothetical protein IT427_02960, partial [Pirellulales bacterium]|nr:hypothetical protein [Pirellulales bacterium]